MTFDITSVLWSEATRDRDAELEREQLVRGKIAVASLWPFLAGATSEIEFDHRLALVEDRIDAAVAPAVHEAVLASVAADWRLLHEARTEETRLRAAEEAAANVPLRLQANHEFFNAQTGRWERVSYIDPSDGQRYNRYPVDPVDNGELQGPDGYVQDLAQGEGRSADAYAFQTTPGAWTVTPGTEWLERPNAATGQATAAQRVAGESVAPTPGPNPNYFSQGSEGLQGPPSFPENPSSAIEPKDDNHVDDIYAGVPPQVSGGSAGEGGGPYTEAARRGRLPFEVEAVALDVEAGPAFDDRVGRNVPLGNYHYRRGYSDARNRRQFAGVPGDHPRHRELHEHYDTGFGHGQLDRMRTPGQEPVPRTFEHTLEHPAEHEHPAERPAEPSTDRLVARRRTAATDGRIVGHCDHCHTPVRYHTNENGVDELRHLHSNSNKCDTGGKRATSQRVTASDPARGSLHSMNHGEDAILHVGGQPHRVHYEAEQAMGDNGQPARGYTTGSYEVYGPDDEYLKSFRHSPYKPNSWAGQAKGYAADQVIDYLRGRLRSHGSVPQFFDPGDPSVRVTAVQHIASPQIGHYMSWARSKGHDPDELSTLLKYEAEPGIGRSTTNHIADQYHLEGPEWRERARTGSRVTANQYIKQQGGKWVITQKGTGKVLSHHDSEEDAEASFRAMMQSKHGGLTRTADDTRVRPTMDNPTGAGDEYQANTWDAQVQQRPMQSAEDRKINSPVVAPEPIRTLDTDGPRERADLNQDENSREASLHLSIAELMEAV